MPDIWSRIYFFYSNRIYPSVKDIRGAWRLKDKLEYLAYNGVPQIDGEATDISEYDWDNLVLMDGCRYDLFRDFGRENCDFRISTADRSPEFITNNFSEGEWQDTVVITANPFFYPSRFEDLTGREVKDVFHEVFPVYQSGWSDEVNTVPADEVKESAITAEKLFPDKRKIIWFMQPHFPFVNAELNERSFNAVFDEETANEEGNIWDKAEEGSVNHEDVLEGYKSNMEYIIPFVDSLVEELSGKTVVTSDHGNLIGENGFYGHDSSPGDIKTEGLRKVPLEIYDD